MAAQQTPNAFANLINVLLLVGLPTGAANGALSRHASDASPDGVAINVVGDLASLPRYRDGLATTEKPDAVVNVRLAATRQMRCSSSRVTAGEFRRWRITQSTG
jgi:hypothetical protein